MVSTRSGSTPTSAAETVSQARVSLLATSAPMARGVPPVGPLPSMPTMASISVRVGRA
ncbi:MAG: hypothetical protein ACOX3S_08705 [Anaerolineae bacterium]